MKSEEDMTPPGEATCKTNIQQITAKLEQNNHGHAKHSKGVFRKLMVQKTLNQTLDNIKTRSHSLHATARMTQHGERRKTCIHQYKECSNQQLTQYSTQHLGNSEYDQ